jgi:RNase P/RNase MRP subunit POP5
MEPIIKAKEEAHKYSLKFKDIMKNIESSMEMIFSYDTLNNEIYMAYDILSYQREGIDEMNSTIMESVMQGKTLVNEANICIINSENDLAVYFILINDYKKL